MKTFISVLSLIFITGCLGSTKLYIEKPQWPVPAPRKAIPMKNLQGENGIWESVKSESNCTKYILELEKRNKKCDAIIDKLNKK